MPYKSEAQRRYMHTHHPEIAKRWDAEETSGTKSIPERVHLRKASPALLKVLKRLRNG